MSHNPPTGVSKAEQKRRLEEQEFKFARGVDHVETLDVQLLTVYAQPPVYGSDDAAGLDLAADLSLHTSGLTPIIPDNTPAPRGGDGSGAPDKYKLKLYPGERVLVHTGVAVAIPSGNYGRIAPRSGLAMKFGIAEMAGVIDSDYRGEVGVILINHGATTLEINHGDRIAQLIIEKYTPVMVKVKKKLSPSSRGGAGFGSTGA
jgi:dUTP pyrophosphatase